MTIRILPAATVALLALSACHNKTEEVTTTAPDPMASVIANRAPVELPPAIRSEATLRCKDNSLVHVTFFEGDKQVLVKSDQAPAVKLTAEKAGDPLTAEGYSLKGDEKSITLTQPGKGELICKA